MKLEEEFVGNGKQFAKFLQQMVNQIEGDGLVIRGEKVAMPVQDVEFKISFKNELGENKLSIKMEWMDG
ncbi:amphi-Trp domain-containing protein [Cohnella thailandensis]|uniref:Amphi-Trp domain-containing protein n=1 Tax=Cohnella thailandensis TaxID=557557 RepID=A0A841SL48_9BACL|nr:amphi-Trp domain-containing protein [Cohnella thailandensis]MBB6632634.1 amphi-Trp domain-containing protein [Cohnella thailandensis]MBP1975677.1 amphi-Trp domain-containing protein [Cohnella thailandensis]